MRTTTNVILSIVLLSATASGCISVHKKETKEVPQTVEHHDTVVVP